MIPLSTLLTLWPDARVTGPLQERVLRAIVPFQADNTDQDVLFWVNQAHAGQLLQVREGVVICPETAVLPKSSGAIFIQVPNPRRAFQQALHLFASPAPEPVIAPSSVIAPDVKTGKNVGIGAFVVVESGCSIGDGSSIDHHTVVKSGTVIGCNVHIGAHCVIGGAGFGYEKNEEGRWERLPHPGNVVLEDGVEIGDSTTIDRAVIGSTVIGQYSKVDNQVHIAHGVQIGANTLVIAQAMIGGSTVIGDNVWVAPSAALINKITVGDNATVGMGAVVIRPVAGGTTVAGNPARPLLQKNEQDDL